MQWVSIDCIFLCLCHPLCMVHLVCPDGGTALWLFRITWTSVWYSPPVWFVMVYPVLWENLFFPPFFSFFFLFWLVPVELWPWAVCFLDMKLSPKLGEDKSTKMQANLLAVCCVDYRERATLTVTICLFSPVLKGIILDEGMRMNALSMHTGCPEMFKFSTLISILAFYY